MNEDIGIDPWSSDGETDYSRIVNQFGLEMVDQNTVPNPGMLHRRGVIFAHRDLDVALRSIQEISRLLAY